MPERCVRRHMSIKRKCSMGKKKGFRESVLHMALKGRIKIV